MAKFKEIPFKTIAECEAYDQGFDHGKDYWCALEQIRIINYITQIKDTMPTVHQQALQLVLDGLTYGDK